MAVGHRHPQALGGDGHALFLHYFEEPDRPQARLDRDLEGGMAVSIGRLVAKVLPAPEMA